MLLLSACGGGSSQQNSDAAERTDLSRAASQDDSRALGPEVFVQSLASADDLATTSVSDVPSSQASNDGQAEAVRVNAWMSKNFERADRVGGWAQAYIDARTGASLVWTPDSIEPPNDPTNAADVHSVQRAWVALGRNYNLAQILTATQIFHINGQRQYADWAAGQLDFYAENYASWPLRTVEGRSAMYTLGLDEATGCIQLLEAARRLQASVEPQRYETWRDKLFAPMAAHLAYTGAPMSNIQLWHQIARAAVAMRFGDIALLDEAQNGPEGIGAIVAKGLTLNDTCRECLDTLLSRAEMEGYASRFSALQAELKSSVATPGARPAVTGALAQSMGTSLNMIAKAAAILALGSVQAEAAPAAEISPAAQIQIVRTAAGKVVEPPAYPAASTPLANRMLLGVRVAHEDWSAARALVNSDVNWTYWVNNKRNQVDTWFAKTRDRADLIGGYPNDLVNAATGAAVRWSMDMPEPPNGSTPAAISFKNAWSAINRMNNITFAVDAARLYRLTGDTKYAKLAAAQLDFYADNYMRWPLRTAIGNARMMGQSLDEATSILELLEAAHALQGYSSPAQKAKWRDGLFFPIAANLQTYSYGLLNNINLWCAIATVAIGLEHNDQFWIDTGATGAKGIAAVMAQGVTKDGIWFEGTFAYNNYVLQALARLFDLASSAGRSDFVELYGPAVQKMLMAPTVYRFDDGTLPSPADTRMAVAPIDLPIHFALYRHVPTTYGLQYAAGIRNWDTLRDRPARTSAPAALPAPQTTFSPDIRMASLRGGAWQLFVHFGQRTINHAQEEALTYELVHGKTSITRDAGAAPSYSSAQQNDYFIKGVGNNVPLIDGQGQDGWAPGEVLGFDPVAGTLDVQHPTYRKDASARRSYKLDSTGFSETSRIALTGSNPTARRLGVMFNTACSVQVSDPRAGVASPSTAPAGSPGFKYWTAVQKQQAEATWTAKLLCSGGKNYELTVAGPGPHTVYRGTAPDTPLPATRNALYVEMRGVDVSFTTSIRALP